MSQNLFAKMLTLIRKTPSANCHKIQSQFFAYLGGGLNAVEQTDLDRHMLDCAECRRELEQCKRSEAALRSALDAVPSPGDLRPGFYAKLAQSKPSRPILAGLRVAVPALAAASLLIVFARPWLFPKPVNPVTPPDRGNHLAGPQSGRSNAADVVRAQPGSDASAFKGDAHKPVQVTAGRNAKADRTLHAERRAPVEYARLAARIKHLHKPVQVADAALSRMSPREILPITTYQMESTNRAFSLDAKTNAQAFRSLSVASQGVEYGTPYADRAKSTEQGGGVVLSSLVIETELHVSDENRDFMSSTRINGAQNAHGKSEAASVDDDNDTAQQPVELPALP